MTEKGSRNRLFIIGAVILLLVMITSTAASAPTAQPVVRYSTRSDTMGPLRDRPQTPSMPLVLGSIFEKGRKTLPNRVGGGVAGPDPVLQDAVGGSSAAATLSSFEGISNVNGVLPPDTQGDVGPNHYVQMVNLSFAIYDRNGNVLRGPEPSNALWSGFGGPCETTNDGDPIVLYDHLADRWMMSQFALPRYPRGPFYQCVAVSQTPDPLGAWHRYEFKISNSKLNDYPKFGLWADGYYMSVNQFSCKPIGCTWGGQGVVAFERDQMLNGAPARMVYFDLASVDGNLGGMLPADLDGPAAPAGAPNPFAQFDDNAWGYSGDQLQFWNFHVDWNNPSNSTFTFDKAVPTSPFDSDMCGYARNCIPQPGGTNVDAISDRLMYRLQYRNFGAYQTLVANHTVDAGSDHAGIRWYELRNTGSGWGINQEGTFAPDGNHRWMGSIAMNGAGDIGLGYSVSSGSTYPSIRYTGRVDSDSLGSMTQGEGVIVAGGGSQSHTSGRWGDYSMMSVDPTDDCTFWYTQEYYATSGNANWHTRIGSFKLRDCGVVDSPPAANITAPLDQLVVSGATVSITANVTDDNGVNSVTYRVDGGSEQSMSLSSGDSTNGTWTGTWDSTGVSEGSHTVTVTVTDGASQTGTDSVSVTVDNIDNPPTITITNPGNGATVSGSVTVTANAGDDHGLTQVEFFVDGVSIGSDGSSAGGWSVAWDTTLYTDGAHTVSAMATDTASQTTTSGSVSVTVNNAPVVNVTVTAINPATMPAGTSILVTITGSGFASGASVTFENGKGPAPSAINVSTVNGTTITATVTANSGGPRSNRVWDVRVTNPGGSTDVLPGGFTITP